MKYASILYEVKFICYLHLIVYGCSFFILCFSLSCSSNQKSESTGQSMKIEVTREPPKPSTDKNTPVSKPKPEPLVTPTTAQEIPTLRHRVVQNKSRENHHHRKLSPHCNLFRLDHTRLLLPRRRECPSRSPLLLLLSRVSSPHLEQARTITLELESRPNLVLQLPVHQRNSAHPLPN